MKLALLLVSAFALAVPLLWLLALGLSVAAARGDRLARAARRRELEPACLEGSHEHV